MACYLITGDDESLLLTAIGDLVKQLVGDGDRSLMVDDFDGDDYEVRSVVDAAQTSPFLTDKRVVVARGVGRFNADDVSSLVAYLADPLPTSELVLVAGGGHVRRDLGVPTHLAPALRARVLLAVAGEPGAEAPGTTDMVWATPRLAPKDHCAELKRQLKR